MVDNSNGVPPQPVDPAQAGQPLQAPPPQPAAPAAPQAEPNPYPPPPAYQQPYPQPQYGQPTWQGAPGGLPSSGIATGAMVVGIVALILTIIPFLTWLGLIGDIVAVSLGAVATSRNKTQPISNAGAAKAGLILGLIGIGLFLLVIIIFASLFGAILGGLSSIH
jgi:hypothetical protein